ncbi:MAG: fused MFS/spermidine synthase [Elusimicrobia bacterium]|nr:fused MFS/spermidine synthase [Elusimicrobiota bacterium]
MVRRNQEPTGRSLFAPSVFVSAFLLFQIELIAGKKLLPYLGGGSSVWAASLLFFVFVLFLGYTYVFFLARYSQEMQKKIHFALLSLGAATLLATLVHSRSLFPSLASIAETTLPPYLKVAVALCAGVGLPFFILSTSGPLLQYWYGQGEREPYKLYAISNAGSLLGLVTYPFLFEPVFALHASEYIWALLFFACAGAIGRIAYETKDNDAAEVETAPIGTRRKVEIALLGGLASFMLIATTTQITHVLVPVPLLWMLPLSLYLLSFILTFGGWESVHFPASVLLLAVISQALMRFGWEWTAMKLSAYSALLFACGLMCHARVYALRPRKSSLPLFYLIVSFGGMLGTLCGSLLAPLLFRNFVEFQIGLALSGGAALWLVPAGSLPRMFSARAMTAARVLGTVGAGFLVFQAFQKHEPGIVSASRNFYGSVRIQESADVTWLWHDSTVHGSQFNDPKLAMVPTTYYTPKSGVGRAITFARLSHPNAPISVGVLGLGAGTLAAYCAPADAFVFYEIDPRVIQAAGKEFSFLRNCAGASVRAGDARLTLERELRSTASSAYDVLVVDAFSDDSVPVHLLTKEAVKLYLERLKSPEGIIAINATSRYLHLAPIAARIAGELGLSYRVVVTDEDASGGYYAVWVLLARDSSIFLKPPLDDIPPWKPYKKAPLWTDDYSDIVSELNFPVLPTLRQD